MPRSSAVLETSSTPTEATRSCRDPVASSPILLKGKARKHRVAAVRIQLELNSAVVFRPDADRPRCKAYLLPVLSWS